MNEDLALAKRPRESVSCNSERPESEDAGESNNPHNQSSTTLISNSRDAMKPAKKRRKSQEVPHSVSVDMSEAQKQERLQAEDGLGESADDSSGNVSAAAAIMADCKTTPFPAPLPPVSEHGETVSSSSGLSSLEEVMSNCIQESSLEPQIMPEDFETIVSRPEDTSAQQPMWLLSATVVQNSSKNGDATNASFGVSHSIGGKRYDFGRYRDSTSNTTSKGSSSGSRRVPSFDSNQRTQGSSMSEQSSLSNTMNNEQDISLKDTRTSNHDTDTLNEMETSQRMTIVTPSTIDQEMNSLMSNWSLLQIKFHHTDYSNNNYTNATTTTGSRLDAMAALNTIPTSRRHHHHHGSSKQEIRMVHRTVKRALLRNSSSSTDNCNSTSNCSSSNSKTCTD